MTQRYIKLALNVFGSLLGRSINVLSTAVTVPIALHDLGTTDYAVYATVVSFSLFFGFSDLGIALSVVNPVASARTEAETAAARDVISQAWGIQLMAAAIVGLGCGLGATVVSALAPSILPQKMAVVLVIALFSVGVGLASGLAQRVLFGLGRNLEANAWLVSGRLLAVAMAFLTAHLDLGLPGYVVALQLVPALTWVVAALVLFGVRRRDLAPKLSQFRWPKARKQLGAGILFSVLSFAVYCEMGLDAMLLGLVSSPDQVTLYDVTSKPFFYLASFSGLLLFPLWPFITREIAEGRMPSRKTILVVSALLACGLAVIAGVMFVFIDEIVFRWVGIRMVIDPVLAFCLAANGVLFGLGVLQSMILNARNEIRVQAMVQAVFIAILIPAKLLLGHIYGPAGVAGALTVAYLPRLFYGHHLLTRGR